jgi:hypothetical protein
VFENSNCENSTNSKVLFEFKKPVKVNPRKNWQFWYGSDLK